MKVLGVQSAHINTGSYTDGDAPSAAALPGSGGLSAKYILCQVGINLVVADNLHVYIAINGGSISSSSVRVTTYTRGYFAARPQQFQMGEDQTGKFYGNFNMSNEGAGGEYAPISYTFPTTTLPEVGAEWSGNGYTDLGHISNFSWVEGSNDGYLYTACTFLYSSPISDPIFPTPVRITLPNFKRFYNYFAGAIRKSNGFQSCDRAGGNMQIRKNGAWRDCKNQFGDASSQDTVFIRKNGTFIKSALTGSK